MLASNGQVAYLGYDPKSDGSGEFCFSLPFSVSIPFSAVVSSFSFPVLSAFSRARLGSWFPYQRIEVDNAQRAAAAAASDPDSDLSSNWWL